MGPSAVLGVALGATVDPFFGTAVVAVASILAAGIATWGSKRAKKVDESVEITKLQMQTWKDIVADRDHTVEQLEEKVAALEARLAPLADPDRSIAERDAVTKALGKHNKLLHDQLAAVRAEFATYKETHP